MTYCLGIKINKGLLFMSDTRTNAGVDNISTFKKIFTFNYKEKVYITILASGNLATTQFLVNSLNDIFREKNKDKSKVFFQNLSSTQKVMKLFPIEALGGLPYLKAVSAAFNKVKFIPTGGINEINLASYIDFPSTFAIGGSWMFNSKLYGANQINDINFKFLK